MEGFLLKKTSKGGWKKRWCVFSPDKNTMSFNDKNDHTVCKGRIRLGRVFGLPDATGERSDRIRFEAIDGQVVMCHADSRAAKEHWLQVLNQHSMIEEGVTISEDLKRNP